MRTFIFLLLTFFAFTVSAQEPELVPVTPEKKEEKKEEEKKEEKEEAEAPQEKKQEEETKNDYQQLYKKYLEKYKKEQKPAAQPKPEAKPEPAQKPEPAAQKEATPKPEPTPQPKPEPKPAADVKPVVQPKPAPKAETKPQPAPEPEAAANKEKEEIKPVEMTENKPAPVEKTPQKGYYFSINGSALMSNGLTFFGDEVLNSSYQLGIDNAALDFRGGNSFADLRLAVDFGDASLITKKTIEPNYEYNLEDNNTDNDNVDYITNSKVMDYIRDLSIKINLPYNLRVKTGKFMVPFGIENALPFEADYYYFSMVRSHFLGGAFNDLALQLGIHQPLNNKMKLDGSITVFNGKNATMLDGEGIFQIPAVNFDARFLMEDILNVEAALSIMFGPNYRPLDTKNNPDSIYSISSKSTQYDMNSIEKWQLERNNILIAIGTDVNYTIKPEITAGFEGEFVYSYRNIVNPGGDVIEDKISKYTKDYYGSYGFYAAPYVKAYMADLMIRFSMFKKPYLETYLGDDTTMSIDTMLNINLSDNIQVGLNNRFKIEDEYDYDSTINPTDYVINTFYTNETMIHLFGTFEFLSK